jgi:hypothetical protein
VSIPVELADLAERMAEFGAAAYLVTTNDAGAPHVVSVAPVWQGDELRVPAGATTTANAGARPAVTLLWPGAPGADYGLIVDGTAHSSQADDDDGQTNGDGLAIKPTRAVLHRLATADDELPNCVTLL